MGIHVENESFDEIGQDTWGTPSRRGRGVRSTLLHVIQMIHGADHGENHYFSLFLKFIEYHPNASKKSNTFLMLPRCHLNDLEQR